MKILVCLFSLTLSQFSIAAESLPPPVEVNSHVGSSDSQAGSEVPKDTTLLATPEARACRADAQKFCASIKSPKERAKCIKSHESELKDSCQDAHSRVKK